MQFAQLISLKVLVMTSNWVVKHNFERERHAHRSFQKHNFVKVLL